MPILRSTRGQLATESTFRFIPFVALWVVFTFAVGASGQNIIHTVAGGGVINSNPALADIPGPTAVVEDTAGNKYVAAPPSNYVFELTVSNTVQAFAGLGWGHYNKNGGGYNGPTSEIPLFSPSGLGVDQQGSVYIADTENNTIRKVYLSSGTYYIETVVGSRGHCNQQEWPTCGDGGKALQAHLFAPQGILVDSAGDFYVADTGDNVIRFVSAKTDKISLFAGSYNSGNPCPEPQDSCGDGGPATQALLNGPTGASLDSNNNLYIADTFDNRIRCVAAIAGGCGSGSQVGYIYTVAGTGTPGYSGDNGPATQAYLRGPGAVSAASPTTYYIADTKNSCIRMVSSGTITDFAGECTNAGFGGDGGAPTNAMLMTPSGVYVDGAGNVLIADTGNQRIREVTGSGQNAVINTILGGGNGGDGSEPTSATLANPYQVAVDANNNYYIADAANNRIRVVNTQTTPITIATVVVPPGDIATVAGNGDMGYSGDGGPATLATMNSPFGIAVDASGNILISDTSNGWVREVDGTTGIITTLSATKPVIAPEALAIDQWGNLFIADPPAQVIWEVSGGTITVVAGTLGTAGYSGDGGPATLAQLDQPTGVAIDANENLYIADSNNNVIRCVAGLAGGCGNPSNQAGYILTYAYNGNFDFQGDGGPATQASRWLPREVALDSRGNLFIGGGQAYAVQRIDYATGTIISVAGKPTIGFGFSGDGGAATKALLDNMGLAVDGNENLRIADNSNNRIRGVPLVAVANLSPTSLVFGDQEVGTTSPPQTVTLTNTGSDDLFLSSITITGADSRDFSQTNNCPSPPAALAPQLVPPQTCTITVTFTPKKTGPRNAWLTFSDNGYKSPQKVKLSGTGT